VRRPVASPHVTVDPNPQILNPSPFAPVRRRIAIFSVVATALLMNALDSTIVATALHSIQHGLHSSINWTSWVITGYAVGLVLALSLAGKLSDRFGRRRFFLVSVIVFAGSSLCCGLATSIYVLVALRVVQAAGGAGFTPSATAIVVEYFGSARDKALGLFASIFSIGSIMGPVFGGLFVTYWTWRGIFFVNVPIGALLIVACLRFVPRDPERTAERRPMDLSGMVLLGIGVLTLMTGISYLGEAGTRVWSPVFLAPTTIGVLALAQFGRHVRRVADPFVSPLLITGRGFAAVNVINLLTGAVFGMMALVPLSAVDRYWISALGSGTLLTAESVAVIAIAIAAAMAVRRTGYRLPLYLGFASVVAGMVMLAIRPPTLSAYLWLAIGACVVGIGEGLSSPASRNAGLQLAPDRSAALAALRSTWIQVGEIASVSITAAILAQAHSPGQLQAKVYVAFALLLVLCTPVITRVPEHRGSW
jgi:EmrB/QacA subfamily drug resistance transporter